MMHEGRDRLTAPGALQSGHQQRKMSSSRLWPRLRFWKKSRDGPHPLWTAVASVRAIWSGASPRSCSDHSELRAGH